MKATRGKRRIIYKVFSIGLRASFFSENLEARRQWTDIFKVLKEKNPKPKILYLAKLSFKN